MTSLPDEVVAALRELVKKGVLESFEIAESGLVVLDLDPSVLRSASRRKLPHE